MPNVTPTHDELIANIKSMESQGAPQQDIQQYLDRYKGQTPGQPMTIPQQQSLTPDQSAGVLGNVTGALGSFFGGVANVAGGIGTGVAKEAGRVMSQADVLTKLHGMETGDTKTFAGLTPEQQSGAFQAQGGAEQLGQFVAQTAEFMAPVGAVRGAESAIQASEALPSIVKVGAKALTEAGTGGLVSLSQTNDPKQAATTAMTFGLTKGATGALGAGAKALGLPEHMYSTIFKNTANDMLNELKTTGIATLQKQNPTAFKQFVDAGIIKTAANGTFTVDQTLARQALNKGLRGSIQNMANVVTKDTMQNELDAQQLAKGYGKPVPIQGADKLSGLLKTVAEDYRGVGQGEIADKANSYAQALETGKGNVDATTALGIRRFLDGMRARSSYNPQIKLSTTAENFKYWSDLVRRGVNQIPGMSDVMKNYSFNIDALTSLAKTASARGNQQLVNMLDVLIFEGGMTGGVPGAGASMTIARKAISTPYGATQLGSAIEKSGSLTKTGAAFKGATSELLTGGAGNQEQQ